MVEIKIPVERAQKNKQNFRTRVTFFAEIYNNKQKSNKLEFDWNTIQNLVPTEWFKVDTYMNKKLKPVIDTIDPNSLLTVCKNEKGIDFGIKPDKFNELFSRTIDPPNALEFDDNLVTV